MCLARGMGVRGLITAVMFLVGGCASDAASPVLSPAGERGRLVAERVGCANCHEGGDDLGPRWAGEWGSTVMLEDGGSVVFDEAYVEDSIRVPQAARRSGDWIQMPAYAPDQLSDDDVDDIVAYIRELTPAP